MKTIALDYDNTFTTDPEAWEKAMLVLKYSGFRIIGITMRYPEESYDVDMRYGNLCDQIHFTSRKAKMQYCHQNNIRVDIWIDDNPNWLFKDAL
jgi:5'(3')-deoxyribonucleotidase